jgi:hypothetical protein
MTLLPDSPKHVFDCPHPLGICLLSTKVGFLTFDTGVVSSFVATAFEGLG